MHPDRQIIYQTAIQRMVTQALEEKETQFQADHAEDTEEQLLQYLCACAKELGHTPYPKEIVGGRYLLQRFETWENALTLARLPKPNTPNKVSAFALVVELKQIFKTISSIAPDSFVGLSLNHFSQLNKAFGV